jgi:hexokinase
MNIENMVSSNYQEGEPENVQQAQEFLASKNLGLLTSEEIQAISADFSKGLTGDFPMVDTHVGHIHLEDIPAGKKSLVIVFGGTFVRNYHVEIPYQGHPVVENDSIREEKIGRAREFASTEEFCDAMLAPITPLPHNNPNAVAVIYAFGATPVVHEGQLDVIPFRVMGKGFAVEGVDGQPLGSVLFDRPAMYPVGNAGKTVINDVPALGTIGGGKLCAFNSSGFNIGVMIDGTWKVTECGGAFRDLPANDYSSIVDANSNNPGHGLLEKQLTVPYMRDIFTLAINDLKTQGLIQFGERQFAEEDFSAIANGDSPILKEVSSETAAILQMVARVVGFRSAQAMGTLLGTTIATFSNEFPNQVVNIPVQSKIVYAMNNYEAIATATAADLSGKEVHFLNIPDGDILGAAVIALYQEDNSISR